MEVRHDSALLEAAAQLKVVTENYHSPLNAVCFCIPGFKGQKNIKTKVFSPSCKMKEEKQNNQPICEKYALKM